MFYYFFIIGIIWVEDDTIKRNILFITLFLTCLFIITGCGAKKEERTINYLLDGYVRAYTKADLVAEKDIFPEFYLKANEKYVNQEGLNKEMNDAKEKLGDDFNITYTVDKETEMSQEDLDSLNKKYKDKYDYAVDATACYVYEGTVEMKGSKDTVKGSLSSIARCMYDGTWYLIKK